MSLQVRWVFPLSRIACAMISSGRRSQTISERRFLSQFERLPTAPVVIPFVRKGTSTASSSLPLFVSVGGRCRGAASAGALDRRTDGEDATRGTGLLGNKNDDRDDQPEEEEETEGRGANDECADGRLEESEEDERPSETISSALLGRPQPNPDAYRTMYRIPKTFEGWKHVLREVWVDYLSTFDGFGKKEEEKMGKDADASEGDGGDMEGFDAEEKKKEIQENLVRNVVKLQEGGATLLDAAKKETGISTKDDLKRWAGEQMKLATECLSEFMRGYREGRDKEVDKMLNEYFKELDEEEGKGINHDDGEGATLQSSHVDTEAPSVDQVGDDPVYTVERRAGRKRRRRGSPYEIPNGDQTRSYDRVSAKKN